MRYARCTTWSLCGCLREISRDLLVLGYMRTAVIPIIRTLVFLSDNRCFSESLSIGFLYFDGRDVRAELIVEYPCLLVVHLQECFKTVVKWQRAMSDFLHDCLEDDYRRSEQGRFH